jgi:hypothetical protein
VESKQNKTGQANRSRMPKTINHGETKRKKAKLSEKNQEKKKKVRDSSWDNTSVKQMLVGMVSDFG